MIKTLKFFFHVLWLSVDVNFYVELNDKIPTINTYLKETTNHINKRIYRFAIILTFHDVCGAAGKRPPETQDVADSIITSGTIFVRLAAISSGYRINL